MSLPDVDITVALDQIMYLIWKIFKFAFDFMRGIQFFGTNLFSFTITVFLLLIIFPIIFTLVQSKSVRLAGAANESLNKIKSRRSRAGSSTELTTRD